MSEALLVELSDRAHRLVQSAGGEAPIQINVKSVEISWTIDQSSQTTLLVVRDDDIIVFKELDGAPCNPWATADQVLPFVVEILRDYMILDDLANV